MYHTDTKKLNNAIDSTTKSLNSQAANMQALLQGIAYRVIGHTDDSCAQRLVNKLPAALKPIVKKFMLDTLPLIEDEDTKNVRMKSGTKPSLSKAEVVANDLPDWQTFKKPNTAKTFDAMKVIAALATKLKKQLKSEGLIPENQALIDCFLSYEKNILAGVPLQDVVQNVKTLQDQETRKAVLDEMAEIEATKKTTKKTALAG